MELSGLNSTFRFRFDGGGGGDGGSWQKKKVAIETIEARRGLWLVVGVFGGQGQQSETKEVVVSTISFVGSKR